MELFISTSVIKLLELGWIDSPNTLILSTDTNQLKSEGTLDINIPFTGLPLQISIFVCIDKVISGWIWTTIVESGPGHP